MSASSKKTFAGVTTGTFIPAPGSLAEYDTPGQAQPPTVDVTGALGFRGPVITDEGGFRDDFSGVALGPDWTSFSAGGVVLAVGTVPSSISFGVPVGAVATDRAYASQEIDFLPLIINVALNNLANRTAGYEFFFGLYGVDPLGNPGMDPDVAIATGAYIEQRFLGPPQLATQANIFTQSSPGDAESSANITVVTTAAGANNCSWRTLALDGEAVVFRDVNTATNALPTTGTKATRSRHIPDLYQALFFSMGVLITAGVGAIAAADTYSVDTLFVKNLDRLVVNTGF